MTLVAQNFKILLEQEKRTVHGSALVTFSYTKQGFAVPRGKQRCMENGLCNICNFLDVLILFVFTTNLMFQLDMIFCIAIGLKNELTKQMIDQEDNINLGRNVFDDNIQERTSWAFLGQPCSRSLIVSLSQPFVILLIIFGCFWRTHLSRTCDESTVLFGIMRSATRYILPSPRLSTS